MMRGTLLFLILLLLSGCGTNPSSKYREAENSGAVRVGILDSGIQSGKDFRADSGWNYLDDSEDTEDEDGHGTQMAELICQYAPDAVIVPMKISGKEKDTTPELVIRAIYDAVDQYDCRILCMSFSIPESKALSEAVAYAEQKNVVLVSAVGNLGETYKKEKLLYPAAYDQVIGVGAVEENGEVADYSQRNTGVFVTALGSSLDGNGKGTSYAAARIAGICAKSQWNTPVEFREYLKSQAKDCGEPGYDTAYGWGVIGIE